jgi:hypothetical protein
MWPTNGPDAKGKDRPEGPTGGLVAQREHVACIAVPVALSPLFIDTARASLFRLSSHGGLG